MIDFDKGRRRFVNAVGTVGRDLCLSGRNPQLFGPMKETVTAKKRRSARSEDLMREHRRHSPRHPRLSGSRSKTASEADRR